MRGSAAPATANFLASGMGAEQDILAVHHKLLPTADIMAESYDFQALEVNPGYNAQITKLWLEMADIIGDHQDWPLYIRAIFWQKDIGYLARLKIVIFSAVNGLPPRVLKEWLITLGCIGHDDQDSWDHILWLIYECYDAKKTPG